MTARHRLRHGPDRLPSPTAANNEEIRRFLRDERLQAVVRDVDGATNREAALKSMLKAPNFKEFTDKVLEVAAPPE